MHPGGTQSWRVSYGGSLAVDVALYIRDTLALSVDTRPHIASLDPSVPVFVPENVDRTAVALEWPDWWADVLAWSRTEVPGPQALSHAPMVETSPALANRPAMRAALAALTVPAARYHATLSHAPAIPVDEVVRALEAELGRPVKPFHLVITQIRVSEPLWEPLTETHVLASHRFTGTTAALREVLLPLA
ncbi:hypothetical protein KIPE111705_03295 [Kibdelosporangium persicum]|uniref:Uncharacterized protein n=1 Tax=Kibdelosporangium persicum TaxID=2698649 RepID=A0ABX2F7U1_9PSEU|nr:hypothetical protein [Kibdelosporangium persicum]NRN67416.1 hypothetical protein [Kibdelosporangium persicum]